MIGVHNIISKAFFRMERDIVVLHVSNTTKIFRSIVEWYMVKCGLKEMTPEKHVFRRVGLHAQSSKHKQMSYLHDIVQFLIKILIFGDRFWRHTTLKKKYFVFWGYICP